MYPNMNEDVAWQRVLDVQREMQNSRLLADQGPSAPARVAQRLGRWIWALIRQMQPSGA